jgi:aspartate/methionine/tyrosine aminotransferase
LIAGNLELLADFFAGYQDLFDWQVPDGGCIAYPRYKGADGVERFCQELVEQSGVLLLPASVYRSELTQTPNDRFRIGYGRANTAAGLDAMREHLAQGGNP